MDDSPNDPKAEGQTGPSCATGGCPFCRPWVVLVLVLMVLAIVAWSRWTTSPGPKLNPQAVEGVSASPSGGSGTPSATPGKQSQP